MRKEGKGSVSRILDRRKMELGLPKFRIHTKRNRISEATRGRETEEMMKATEVTRFRIQVFEGQGRRARAYQVS